MGVVQKPTKIQLEEEVKKHEKERCRLPPLPLPIFWFSSSGSHRHTLDDAMPTTARRQGGFRVLCRAPRAPPSPAAAAPPLADLILMDMWRTGFGNPDWARTHESTARTSPAILAIVNGGATCVGKTVMSWHVGKTS
ncbi:hypothetical protein Cni_G06520 [Canna indica]|uniref:Uncharacterized protein n=1 Tax=Canna indica TaxID=4628 RepID=A0AAQ3JX75_9LILI|nr:hypothetical protein Cni_G06520 [Canna indica]